MEDDSKYEHRYIVTTNGETINKRFFEENGIEDDEVLQSGFHYSLFVTSAQAEKIRKLSFIKEVASDIAPKGTPGYDIFPQGESFGWNADQYGPLYVPRKGDVIELNEKNKALYGKCIALENEDVSLNNGLILISGKTTTSYRFKHNHYFLLGDSRDNSLDSRYWGFVPENLIIGKPMYIDWSKYPERLGMEIH